MTTHSSILAWRIPWTEEPVAEPDTTERLTHTAHSPRIYYEGRFQVF